MVEWCHLSLKLTVVDPSATGLVHGDQVRGATLRQQIERHTGSLWQGNLDTARDTIEAIESWLDHIAETSAQVTPWLKAVEAFRTSVEHNGHVGPHAGERYRHGEAMAPDCVASPGQHVVSPRICKPQHRQGVETRGASAVANARQNPHRSMRLDGQAVVS
jgi:hypothetical protein